MVCHPRGALTCLRLALGTIDGFVGYSHTSGEDPVFPVQHVSSGSISGVPLCGNVLAVGLLHTSASSCG